MTGNRPGLELSRKLATLLNHMETLISGREIILLTLFLKLPHVLSLLVRKEFLEMIGSDQLVRTASLEKIELKVESQKLALFCIWRLG